MGTRRRAPSRSTDVPAGSIVHLAMRNFMVFREVALSPGRGFNVVVGPNGSGKSTIVSALTIGLGGDVATLKRQQRLADFINAEGDASHAEIEVTLQGGQEQGGRTVTVRCRIPRASSSVEFWIDGQKVGKKAVCQLARELQIQTDNLCQFLPQDVVREFPQMSPNKVFHSTVRAVGDVETLELHKELVAKREEARGLRQDLEQKEVTRTRLRKQHEGNADTLDSIKMRDENEKLAKLLRLRLQYAAVAKLRDRCQNEKKKLVEAQEKRAEERKRRDQLRRAMEEFYNEKKELQRKIKVKDDLIKDVGRRISQTNVADKDSEIQAASFHISLKRDDVLKRKKKLADLKQKIIHKGKQVTTLNQENLEAQKERHEGTKEALEVDESRIRTQTEEKKLEIQKTETCRMERQSELNHLKSCEVRMLKLLKQRNPDAHGGVEWLRGGGNRRSFSRPIHDPMMLTIRLKDDSYATYVERLVSRSELETFVCEDAGDASRLMNTLRKNLRLRRINVLHSPADLSVPLEQPPSNLPRELVDSLVEYVADMMDCPPAVRNYLCFKKNLHRIPVFSDDVDSELAVKFFRKFFIEKKLYTVVQSRYRPGEYRTNVDDLSHDTPSCFVEIPERQKLAALEEEIKELGKTRSRLQGEKQELEDKGKELSSLKMQEMVQLDALEGRLRQKARLKNEVACSQKQLVALSRQPTDISATLKESLEDRKLAVRKMLHALVPLCLTANEGVEASVEVEKLKVALHKLERSYDRDNYNLAMAEKSLKKSEDKYNELSSSLKALHTKLQHDHRELEWENPSGTKLSRTIPKDIKRQFDEYTPPTASEVEALLKTTLDDLHVLPVVSDAQKKSVLETTDKLNQCEEEVEELSERKTRLESDSWEKNRKLTQRVQKLVRDIDQKFSSLMEAFGNAGEVQLEGDRMEEEQEEAAGGKRGSEYKLNIMVRFANSTASLQKLSGSVQSGGEKSVVTALYMMALQELTKVPFRVVDEINQGMDEENEKLIWRQLMETAAKYSAQYFYFAPKFPRSLDFNDDVTVVLCNNGSAQKRKAEMDLDTIVKRLRK